MGKRSRQNLKLISCCVKLVAPARVTAALILDLFCYFLFYFKGHHGNQSFYRNFVNYWSGSYISWPLLSHPGTYLADITTEISLPFAYKDLLCSSLAFDVQIRVFWDMESGYQHFYSVAMAKIAQLRSSRKAQTWFKVD